MKIHLESRDFKKAVDTRAKTIVQLFKEQNLLSDSFIVAKNGELATESETLKNGDKLKLYPVVSGG